MRDVPIGIQDFKEIRDNGYYFVDKSDLIAQILEKPATKVFLFTRPRRFGKSLNLSMMDAFLNIRYAGNTWFDGLSVSARKDYAHGLKGDTILYGVVFDSKAPVILSDRISL